MSGIVNLSIVFCFAFFLIFFYKGLEPHLFQYQLPLRGRMNQAFQDSLPMITDLLNNLGLNYRQKNYICIGNSMICSDIWYKYHKWYFKIVICNFMSCLRPVKFETILKYHKCYFMPNIMHKSCYHLFILTTRKRFVIFTCRYFKLSWNTTALSQSNGRYFSCSSKKSFTE